MILEAKKINPITLKLSKKESILVSEEGNLPLKQGVVFGGDHYGFTLIVEKGEEETKLTYPTQCRIYGAQITGGYLTILEDHKYIPWKFKQDGTLLNNAVFSNLKKDEIEYIEETYGVKTEQDLIEINDYRKCLKKTNKAQMKY